MPIVTKQTPKQTAKPLADMGWPSDDYLSILLYGRSGTGKTTLWATFPAPILVVVCSGGIKSGELRSVDTPENRKRIFPRRLTSSSQMIDALKEAGKYKTVVLDHVSGLQDLILKEVLGIEEIPAQKSWGLATQQQYGQCTMQCKEILRNMLGLSCNKVIIGQEREDHTEEDNGEILTPTVGVATTPSLANWLNPAVDYICQTFIRQKIEESVSKIAGKTVVSKRRGKGVDYCLRTAPHDVFTTKFRVPKGAIIPEVLVDPSYDKIVNLIRGGK